MELDGATQLDLLARAAIAVLLGSLVGIERELQSEEAGLRTHALVALGAAMFTVVSSNAFQSLSPDPTRIAAQIVTGIGFIGAGTIIRQERSVRGLSTAASLWAVGAVGMACGAGLYVFAVGGTVLALVVLEVLDRMEQAVLRDRVGRGRHAQADEQAHADEGSARTKPGTLRQPEDRD